MARVAIAPAGRVVGLLAETSRMFVDDVASLVLDDGTVLNEGAAVLQLLLADQARVT